MGNSELTLYGKEVRKLRIEAGVLLGNHADAVGKSASLLSGIESGRKTLTDNILNKTICYFQKLGLDAGRLTEAAKLSAKQATVSWEEFPFADRKLFYRFATEFPSMTEEQKKALEKLMEKCD